MDNVDIIAESTEDTSEERINIVKLINMEDALQVIEGLNEISNPKARAICFMDRINTYQIRNIRGDKLLDMISEKLNLEVNNVIEQLLK